MLPDRRRCGRAGLAPAALPGLASPPWALAALPAGGSGTLPLQPCTCTHHLHSQFASQEPGSNEEIKQFAAAHGFKGGGLGTGICAVLGWAGLPGVLARRACVKLSEQTLAPHPAHTPAIPPFLSPAPAGLLMDKINVNGSCASPVYNFLKVVPHCTMQYHGVDAATSSAAHPQPRLTPASPHALKDTGGV